MVSRIGLWISRVFRRAAPDPFVIAIVLTALTALLAWGIGDFGTVGSRPGGAERAWALLDAWRGPSGLWALLKFSMQMCLVLVTGYALAETGLARAAIGRLTGAARTARQGVAIVGLAACACALVNWGLGLIVGAILARDMGRALEARGVRAHYPLLCAAGYLGLMVWHGGLSGSAPLSMTSLSQAAGVLPAPTIDLLRSAGYAGGIGLGETLFSRLNLIVTPGLVLAGVAVAVLLCPAGADCRPVSEVAPERAVARRVPDPPEHEATLASRLDRSRMVAGGLGMVMLLAFVRFAWTKGAASLSLDEVNMAMLGAGLVLHGSARSYLAAAEDGARACLGIIVQFPLYGGIIAMMVASGLVKMWAEGIASAGDPRALPLLTFLAAGVINLFVPSGGGQWSVQGPVALEAGLGAGLSPGSMVMAVAYGDQLTNMLQPFWALPLLAITGVKAREIVGYTAVVMVAGGVWIAGALWLLAR